MPFPHNLVRDLDITIGPYRILQRTDGDYIAFDDRQPLGKKTAFRHHDRAMVERWIRDTLGLDTPGGAP